jgi:homoserine/homoserine lactone efflux protein
MSPEFFLAYLFATAIFALIPGPMVTLIVANSLRHGTRAGLLNVAGAQLGLTAMIGVLVVGLASVIAFMGVWFDWQRFLGAAYLVWLGWKLIRHPAALGEAASSSRACSSCSATRRRCSISAPSFRSSSTRRAITCARS